MPRVVAAVITAFFAGAGIEFWHRVVPDSQSQNLPYLNYLWRGRIRFCRLCRLLLPPPPFVNFDKRMTKVLFFCRAAICVQIGVLQYFGDCGRICGMDTLAISEELIVAGVSEPAAKAHARIL